MCAWNDIVFLLATADPGIWFDLQAMLAGGIGGTLGDMLMHSLDTVKTRQQGDPHFPPKYTSMTASYATIYRQEGLFRGLYGGVTPAFLGSFPGTVTFFGVYEFTKRWMLDAGINPNIAYLSGGQKILFPCAICAGADGTRF